MLKTHGLQISPDLNPLDYHVWGAMLDKFDKLNPKPQTVPELKRTLQTIWNDLSQDAICKAVLLFRKRLDACVKAGGGHFEHLQN